VEEPEERARAMELQMGKFSHLHNPQVDLPDLLWSSTALGS
jgi:hypothetical protein